MEMCISKIIILIVLAIGGGRPDDVIECEEMRMTINVQEENIVLSWTRNSCAVAYNITHYVNEDAPRGLVLPDPIVSTILDKNYCSRNVITISIIPRGETPVDTISEDFVIGLRGADTVQNLHFNTENERFEWDAPEESEGCEVEYEIDFHNEIIADTDITPMTFYEFSLYFCSTNVITVTAIIVIEGRIGGEVSVEHNIPVPDNIEVQNLRFDEDLSAFVWEAPDRSQICGLEYRVYFENEDVEEQLITSVEFHRISVVPCSNNNIHVVTILAFDDSESVVVSGNHKGPVTRQVPIHINTNPRENSAEVTWRIESEVENRCEVENLRYEVNPVDTEEQLNLYGDFSEENPFEFILTPLEVNQLHQYRVCYVFLTVDDTICSAYVRFLTEPLPVPIINIETELGRNSISWIQSYESEFVTGHTLFLQPLGYNHFVPDHCPIKSETVKIDFEPGITSYNMKDLIPSFKYSGKIMTHFDTLGMATTSDESLIITNEGVPGYLDIRNSFEVRPSALYNVDLDIEWDIPCDINGQVRSFTYTIERSISSDFNDFCDGLDFMDGTITVIGDDETYNILISGVLPFFQYFATIVTNLREHSGTTVVTIEDPPQAHSPSV